MGIKHDFRQVGDIISIHDIVCAIKRAVLDCVEDMRHGNHERVLERDRIASRELELFAVSLEWMKPSPVWEELFERADHNPSKVFTEKELDKIQFQINENGDDLKSTIYKALAYWQATEVHKSKGKYTELYMIEQTERFRRAKGFGFEIDREGEMLRNWLANIHAINWLKEVEQQSAVTAGDQVKETAGTEAEIITDNRKKIEDQLFEETLLPIIFEKLKNGNFKTNKKILYEQIAEPYQFGGEAIRKRFEKEYKPHREKLHEALRKYGNERLIDQIKQLR